MSKLIDAFHSTDRDLVAAIGIRVEPQLLLDRVEAGSIRAWIRTVLHQVNDEALLNLDWKPLVGQYLVQAKHGILRWLDGRPTIASRAELMELQEIIVRDAPPVARDQLALPASLPPERLLADLQRISEAAQELGPADRILFEGDGQQTPLDTRFALSSERLEELLTREVHTSQVELRLPIKKPDYLGRSRWEFVHDQHLIEASIQDHDWLDRFQKGLIALRPGDALHAIVRSEQHVGFEGNVIGMRHTIVRVLGVVRGDPDDQTPLPLES